MDIYELQKPRKSIGCLKKQKKTKPRSPDCVGKIMIQRQTWEIISRQFDASNDEQITACLAGWQNRNEDGPFLTVELSPYFAKKKTNFADDQNSDGSSLFFDE